MIGFFIVLHIVAIVAIAVKLNFTDGANDAINKH